MDSTPHYPTPTPGHCVLRAELTPLWALALAVGGGGGRYSCTKDFAIFSRGRHHLQVTGLGIRVRAQVASPTGFLRVVVVHSRDQEFLFPNAGRGVGSEGDRFRAG